jgi:hypothetical protein
LPPPPPPKSGSGSTDLIESASEILVFFRLCLSNSGKAVFSLFRSLFLYQLLLLLLKTEMRFQMEVSDVQKLGAGLATFGIFFLLLGVLLLFDKAPALIYL